MRYDFVFRQLFSGHGPAIFLKEPLLHMANVEWSYHRNGCKTCGKTQAYLEAHSLAVKEQVIANKVPLAHEKVDELVASTTPRARGAWRVGVGAERGK